MHLLVSFYLKSGLSMAPKKKKAEADPPKWECMFDGAWKPFSNVDAAMLEKRFETDGSAAVFKTIDFSFNREHKTWYSIDFVKMTQTNTESGAVREIRRVGGPPLAKKAKLPAEPKGVAADANEVDPTDPVAHRFYGDTQAFIAVKTEIVSKILEEGYKVEVRDAVPCSSVPMVSVRAVLRNWPDCTDCTALEVHGVDDGMINVSKGRIETKHLAPEHLRDGVFFTRDAAQYADAPCPLCKKIISGKADERGQVGLRRYIQQAFMVVPCDNPECVDLQVQRQKRLDEGRTLWLYHITDRESADKIKAAGGKMLRGGGGNAGGGIYFGLSPADCSSKALHHGVILKCRAQIGLALKHDKCKNHTFASLIKERRDCVWGNIGYKSKSYIIYSWDQVQVAAEVDDKDNIIE